MFVTDYRLDQTYCRRCGAPFPVPGPAISNHGDLCTRCLARVEGLAVRESVVDQTEVDPLRTYSEDFDG